MNGDASKAAGLVARIQQLVDARKNKGLESFVVFMGGPELKAPIEKVAAAKKTTIPLVFLPQGPGAGDVARYGINPKAKNTIVLWRQQTVRQSLVDVDPAKFGDVEKAVDAMLK